MRSRSAIQTVVTVAVLLSLSCTCSALSALAPATETPTPTNTPAPADTRAPTDTPVPTDTPIPTATFTPVPNPGDVLLHDIFTDNGNNWQTFSDAEADGGFANGSYVLNVKAAGKFRWVLQDPSVVNARDVDISFEVTLTDGRNNNASMGAICRYQEASNFYLFQISGDGYYSIAKVIDGNVTMLVDWTASRDIVPGKQTNVIQIICSGNALVLAANGTVLSALEDNSITDAGGIALVAGTFKQPNITVAFDNLTVKVAPKVDVTAAATSTPRPAGVGEKPGITIANGVSFGVRIAVWGPASLQIDIPAGQTVILQAPTGIYGWQVFANGCQLTPTNNLDVNPGAQVFIVQDSSQCGYAVSSK